MRRSMRRLLRPACGAVLGMALMLSSLASAQIVFQRAPFASTPNPVGSGARAVAWGNAFIAIADDATAASWNPGGLTQLLTPEASFALAYHNRMERVDFSGLPTRSTSRSNNSTSINYASLVYPFHLGDLNMVGSINYQRLYEFDRRLKYTTRSPLAGTARMVRSSSFEQIGGLTTLSPAFAVQIIPQWSLGVAVNFWGLDHDGGDGWDQQWQVKRIEIDPAFYNLVTSQNLSEIKESYRLSGINYVIGTHIKLQNLTIGAVYKTAFDANVKYKWEMATSNSDFVNPAGSSRNGPLRRKEDETLHWPESYGLGMAYRVSDRFTFSGDAYTTRWSEYRLRKKDGAELNLLAGDGSNNIRDTWQFHVGAEYLWIQPKYVFALRGGGFYDPEPIQDQVQSFYGAAIGGGIVYQNLVLDAALQYRWGGDLPGEKSQGAASSTPVTSRTNAQELFAIVSLIYHTPGK